MPEPVRRYQERAVAWAAVVSDRAVNRPPVALGFTVNQPVVRLNPSELPSWK